MSEYRYIIVMEDGSLYKGNEITVDDTMACRDGYISIIDVTTGKEYFESQKEEGTWVDLSSWPEED